MAVVACAWMLLALLTAADGSRILALMTIPSHSHHLWNSVYLEALVAKGHHVTYAGLDPYKNPPANLRHVLLEGVYEAIYRDIDMNKMGEHGSYATMKLLNMWDNTNAIAVTKSNGLQSLLKILDTESFDLVVHDTGFSLFMLGAVSRLKDDTPLLGITALGVPPWAHEMVGNPIPYTSISHSMLPASRDFSFWERLNSCVLYLYSHYLRLELIHQQDQHSKKAFGQDTKHVLEIIEKMNIMLVNSDFATNFPFPAVPGLVQVGGIHIKTPKPLPQDLQSYLDTAKHGVIYFSLGSNVMSSTLSQDKIEILIEVFKRLAPVKVLWKWETDSLPGKPSNVEIRKWMPQNDILAHNNCVLFFTHSGLLSTQEATSHGVPIVGMPFFLDQHVNVKRYVALGVGEEIDFQTMTSETVYTTIRRVLDNSRYRDKMRNMSVVFKDSLNSPLETAVYWTEYAIRHKGAPHLRPASRDLYWFQNWLLDIVFVIAVLPSFAVYLLYTTIRRLLRTPTSIHKGKLKKK